MKRNNSILCSLAAKAGRGLRTVGICLLGAVVSVPGSASTPRFGRPVHAAPANAAVGAGAVAVKISGPRLESSRSGVDSALAGFAHPEVPRYKRLAFVEVALPPPTKVLRFGLLPAREQGPPRSADPVLLNGTLCSSNRQRAP